MADFRWGLKIQIGEYVDDLVACKFVKYGQALKDRERLEVF